MLQGQVVPLLAELTIIFRVNKRWAPKLCCIRNRQKRNKKTGYQSQCKKGSLSKQRKWVGSSAMDLINFRRTWGLFLLLEGKLILLIIGETRFKACKLMINRRNWSHFWLMSRKRLNKDQCQETVKKESLRVLSKNPQKRAMWVSLLQLKKFLTGA